MIINSYISCKRSIHPPVSSNVFYNQRRKNNTVLDTVSFGAMKKNEFNGIDFAVVEKFKAPIQKFKTGDDLQEWAFQKLLTDYTPNNFGGRQNETRLQRKEILTEWQKYILEENDAYSNTAALLIMNAVTKNLKANNDTIPPTLNKGVLAEVMYDLDKSLRQNPKLQFDLNKLYRNKLSTLYLGDRVINSGLSGTRWIKIPSKKNDPENFAQNVEKLKTLSHPNWCTKSFNAEPYLEKGDFHIYYQNGKPQIGLRILNDKISEIQGEKNNGKFAIRYLDIVEEYIKKQGLPLGRMAQNTLENVNKEAANLENIKSDLNSAIKNNDIEAIFNYFKISYEKDTDGLYIIERYEQPDEQYSFSDLGIDENKLFTKIKAITGNACFTNSQVENLQSLKSIGKNADFKSSKVIDLGNLELIGRDAIFSKSKIKSLQNLKSIGNNAVFSDSQIKDLGRLEQIGETAKFNRSLITDLKKLKFIGWNAIFKDSLIKNLNNLETIGGNAYFGNTFVTDLGCLSYIGGNADFGNSLIKTLKNLETIGGEARFEASDIEDLGKLKYIGNGVVIKNSKLKPEDFNNIGVEGRLII